MIFFKDAFEGFLQAFQNKSRAFGDNFCLTLSVLAHSSTLQGTASKKDRLWPEDRECCLCPEQLLEEQNETAGVFLLQSLQAVFPQPVFHYDCS